MRSMILSAALFGLLIGGASAQTAATVQVEPPKLSPQITRAVRPAPAASAAAWRQAEAARVAYVGALRNAVDAEINAQKATGTVDPDLMLLKAQLDSIAAGSEMDALRLQATMDRISKMQSTLSNIMNKNSDTAQNIAQNIK